VRDRAYDVRDRVYDVRDRVYDVRDRIYDHARPSISASNIGAASCMI
jgi:hypothetical protein